MAKPAKLERAKWLPFDNSWAFSFGTGMGIFVDSRHEDDVVVTCKVLSAVARYWDTRIRDPWGYTFNFGKTKVSRICHLGDVLFHAEGFSNPPGPFKRAAAMAIFTYLFLDLSFVPLQGNDRMSVKDLKAWKSRIAYLTIAPAIRSLCVQDGDDRISLDKAWYAATLHLRMDILNWLRWLEVPHNVDRSSIDLGRLKRMVLGFSLVIEQSYYISGNNLKCHLMGNAGCLQEAMKDETSAIDVWFMADES